MLSKSSPRGPILDDAKASADEQSKTRMCGSGRSCHLSDAMVRHSTVQDWLSRTDATGHDVKEWCSWKEKDLFFCKICPATFSSTGKGFQAIVQHAATQKHKNSAKDKLDPLQLTLARTATTAAQPRPRVTAHEAEGAGNFRTLDPQSPPETTTAGSAPLLQLRARRDAAVISELRWAMKCVVSGYSNNSCDNIVPLFVSMFGEEHVPKDMSLGRTKVTYVITDALGPYFHKKMLADVHVALSFTICFDETVNNKRTVKELQFGIRYWSEKEKAVSYHHLETVFIGSATGVILTNHLMAVLERASLSLHRFLMLSCDGPNVNKTVLRLVNEKVKEFRAKGLMDAGTCNLHILHNAFLSGLEVFGEDVGQLVISIYDFFHGFPSRVEEYKKSQLHAKVPDHLFLKHVTSRWLTLSEAAERLLEQWPAVVHFFLTVIPKSNSDSHKKISETQRYLFIRNSLKDSTFQAKVSFVIQSANLFERFSKIFQKSEPMVHLLYDELCSLYVLLLGRFLKSQCVSTSRACLKEEFINNTENLLPLKDVDCGAKTEEFLKKCMEVDVLKFKQDAQKHYKAASLHLLKKSVLSKWPDGKHLKCLQPGAIKNSSPRDIALVYKMLRLDLSVDEDSLKDEWRVLKMEELPLFQPQMRIDHFWSKIFDMTGPDGQPKYPNISKVVKATLPISHGSSDVERGFSESKHQLRPEQSRMEERLLNAKLWVKDGLKVYEGRPDFVPMTRELLDAGHRAYRSYADHMQEEKEKEEARLRREAEAVEERRAREEIEMKQREDQASIETMQKKISKAEEEERDQRQAADKLVEDATRKLEEAIKSKDFASAKIAQGMLAGAKLMKEKALSLEKKNEPLKKKVNKRTSNLLKELLKNHKKRPRMGENEDENPDDPS
ncbi:Reticulocyte-binding protein 2-like protein a [Frankliniella fusca]|uniref:Reticulocyte-binding protein 2-like protein a n=1 Tax=Frankliniella fusca TaxID=407009 RepID=A0AAE1HL64_9NEOP|nr:Reticulocyte-binding protein 2-like protein a [Frankliniella fusca]